MCDVWYYFTDQEEKGVHYDRPVYKVLGPYIDHPLANVLELVLL